MESDQKALQEYMAIFNDETRKNKAMNNKKQFVMGKLLSDKDPLNVNKEYLLDVTFPSLSSLWHKRD